MQIAYRLLSGVGYVTFCDETAGTGTVKFNPSGSAKVDEQALPGGNAEFRNAMGNVTTAHTISWNQVYATQALALAAVRTIFALLGFGVKFHIQVIQDSEVQYWPNCVATAYVPDVAGVGVDHQLRFNSDAVTTTAP